MCAQCAMVALAAIGTYGVFRDQIRVRIDRSLGVSEADYDESPATLAPKRPDAGIAGERPAEQRLAVLMFVLALGQLRHGGNVGATSQSKRPRPAAG